MCKKSVFGVVLLVCGVTRLGWAGPVSYRGVLTRPVATATVGFTAMVARDAALKAAKALPRPRVVPWMPKPKFSATGAMPKGGTALSSSAPLSPKASAPALSDNFLGFLDGGRVIPPDTDGAAGPSDLMVATNDSVRFQTKTGGAIGTVTLLAFWQTGFPSLNDVFDPKVIYDSLSGRFLFLSAAQSDSAASSALLAVSATSDPTGTWHMYQFDGDAANVNWVDYPNIGVNANWITLTANMFAISGGSYSGTNVWVVDKASALAGPTATSTLFFETGNVFTLVPCTTYSASETTEYMIQSYYGPSGRLRIYTITGPVNAPVFTDTGLMPTAAPWSQGVPSAPQSGSGHTIDTGDDRMLNAVLRNGSLWCTHTVGLPVTLATHTAVKWWQINPVTGATVQSGVLQDTSTGMYYYYPSIAVNANDDVLISFSGSSATTFAGAYYTTRSSGDTLGTMNTVTQFKAGEASYYKTYTGSQNRWGDYSATCVDPTDDVTMWTIQEYAASPSSTWGTWWGKLGDPPTVVMTSTSGAFTNVSPIPVTVTFSKSVTGFTAGGVAASNASVSSFSGSGAVYTFDLVPSGEGPVTADIAAGVCTDLADTPNVAATEFTRTYDVTPPSLAISAPSTALTAGGPVTYTITYAGAASVTLGTGDITLNAAGSANATIGVSGTGTTSRVVTLSGITGSGSLGITIGANTASDSAGNLASAAGPSATFDVVNTSLAVNIGPPSVTLTQNGPVTYTVTYDNATSVTLSTADITLNPTGTATATVGVSGSGTTTRTVTLSALSGSGTINFSIAAGTATDSLLNSAPGAGPSATVTVDNTPPVITLLGQNPVQTLIHSAYVDAGATALDNVDGNLTGSIVVDTSGVNTGALGTYYVTYNVTDSAGNAATQVTREVDVVSQIATLPAPSWMVALALGAAGLFALRGRGKRAS